MKLKKKFLSLMVLFMVVTFTVQNAVYPAVMQNVCITITARVTLHPSSYRTSTATSALSMSSPIVSDLECDDVLEVICAGYDAAGETTYVYIWERNGSVRSGWPVSVSGEKASEPSVGDLDGDGELEIVLSIKNSDGITGSIYAWNADGAVVSGYPVSIGYIADSLCVGDITGDFSDEIVYAENKNAALSDMDGDGKKEIIYIGLDGLFIQDGDGTEIGSVSFSFVSISNPVVCDMGIFFSADNGSGIYLYGYNCELEEVEGFPVGLGDLNNTGGNYLSLADINGDDTPEILTGSSSGYLAAYNTDGSVVFSVNPETGEIYQPVAGDIDSDGDMDIVASSGTGRLYCYDSTGTAVTVTGWPEPYSFGISQGLVLVDIEQDSLGDIVNPAGDLELLLSGNGRVYSIDLPGDFEPTEIQWGMYGFDNRKTSTWLNDYTTDGWSVFDDDPPGAEINIIYDWNRGSRVVELDGAGLNNCYAYMNTDGSYLNTTNTELQWSMRYHLDFAVYVSVDTLEGRRYLYYTATEGDMPQDGQFIHHGLGDVKDGKWHTFSRALVDDLKDAEPDNEIVDINAFYIQGSGMIDDVMFIEADACSELTNYALDAEVSVSSGEETKDNINDGDPDTLWVSDAEDAPWVEYTWDESLDKINKITIENVSGANGCTVYINGVEYEYFEIDDDSIEIVFDSVEDVTSIRVEFDTDGGSVSVGEIGVYYDPNYEDDELPSEEYSTDNYIKMQDGYFWDPTLNDGAGGYWLPHGIAYQTWNEALGQWQSPSEIRSALDDMVSIGANALRVDFVWKHIEESDDTYSWDNYDMLLEEAQARGINVFAIIGYQWPPDWFPDEWYTMHPINEAHPDGPWQSDILSYENDDVRAEFAEFLQAVASRYSVGGAREDLSDTIAGWILGNEYGYLGLWSIEYDGYDDACQETFREWLEERYSGDISALNTAWVNDNIAVPGYLPNYPYADFSNVDMPIPFGYEGDTQGQYLARDKASWYDLTEWREESIAGFIALAAQSIRAVDTAHLITYAAVGMQWGEEDWRYHTEDAAKITQACSDAGVPLDFWSINNYPWGRENDELMTGKWGIERARHDTGLPVFISETGFTSTETIYTGMDEDRQSLLVRNAIWETLECGAVGVCVFHWNDREQIGLTEREKGFGIVDTEGEPKSAYYTVQEAFQKMDEIEIDELLPELDDPQPDIAIYWDDAVDSIVNRYEAEMHQLYGALERLGFDATFINKDDLLAGDYINYKAVVFPRNQKMSGEVVGILPDIALSGVKIHVDCDLPGIMDEYGNSRNTDTDWLLMMQDLFGLDTTASNLDIDTNLEDSDYSYGYYETSSFSVDYMPKTLYLPILGYNSAIDMWKYHDEIVNGSGTVLASFDGATGSPALIVNDYSGDTVFDTAISLFSLGDNDTDTWTWEDRSDWMALVYTNSDDGFGLTPNLEVSGSSLVLANYRVGTDRVLLCLKNYSSDTSETVQITSILLTGRIVEDLINDTVIENPCDGTVERTVEADGHDLLLAYDEEIEEEVASGEEATTEEEAAAEGGTTESAGGSTADTYEASTASGDSSSSEDTSTSSSSSSTSSAGSETTSETANEATAVTSSGTDTSEDDSVSVSSTPSSGFMVILGGGTIETSKASDAKDVFSNVEESVSVPAEKLSHYRSYIGNGKNKESLESNLKGEEILPVNDIPPMEQFSQAVSNAELEMPGVIRVSPERVLREHVEKVTQPKPKPQELPTWAKKLLEWITNLVRRLSNNLQSIFWPKNAYLAQIVLRRKQ